MKTCNNNDNNNNEKTSKYHIVIVLCRCRYERYEVKKKIKKDDSKTFIEE